MGGTLSYLDARITKSNTPTILVGYRLPNAPEFAYSLSGSWSHDFSDAMRVRANVDYSHFSAVFQKAENFAATRKPAYGLLNASVSLGAPGPGLNATLWAKNLTDETYVNYIIASEPLGGEANYGAPRTYGVTLGYNF